MPAEIPTTKFEFPGKLSGYTSPPLLPDHTKVTNPGLWQAVEEEKKRMNDPKTTEAQVEINYTAGGRDVEVRLIYPDSESAGQQHRCGHGKADDWRN